MLIKMILSLLKIGTIGYGGGSAALPLMKADFVDKYEVMSDEEFLEIISICNTLPGPIITKFCAILGYRIKGILGAFIAIVSLILPSVVMLLIILSFVRNMSSENIHITNMVNAIFPVVSVIMIKLTFDFFGLGSSKFEKKQLILYITIFGLLLIAFKVDLSILIIGLILLCVFIPKQESENE